MTAVFQFRPRTEIDRARWNAFADANDETWFWHRAEFIDANAWHGSRDVSFGVFDHYGSLLAIMPLYLVSRPRFARRATPLYLFSQGGPAIIDRHGSNSRQKLVGALESRLRELIEEYGAQCTEAWVSPLAPFLHGPAAPRANPLYHFGFEDTSVATWMLDLSLPVEEIRRNYSETTRQILKKANRDSFTIREAHGGRDLETYYELHLETIRRKESVPESFDFFEAIFERMAPEKFVRIMFFEQGGRVTAANNALIYKAGAFYWTGASLSEKHEYESRVLLDDQIIHARNRGCVRFEVGEAYVNRPNAALLRGTSNFKRSFGSELVTFYRGRIRGLENLSPMIPGGLMRVLSRMLRR